jgi:glutamate formiminotransferase
MRLVTVPNWSFARETSLRNKFLDVLSHPSVSLHYCESDVDLNRTVTAFSAAGPVLVDMVIRLAMAAFEVIDLNRHTGSHPRIGALDVCPIVLPIGHRSATQAELLSSLAVAENLASQLAAAFELPVILYERSERGRHEADLASLRKGGFGGLSERSLRPDFGPAQHHPRLGVSVVGVRDFMVSINFDLRTDDMAVAEKLAGRIRSMRGEGDERMLGVRAMALVLPSRGRCQVAVHLTLPDLTPIDPIIEWIMASAPLAEVELVGVIRDVDMPRADRLPVRPEQIIATV